MPTFVWLLTILALIVATETRAATVQAATSPSTLQLPRDAADQSPFGWKPCPNSQDDRWRCGRIKVPMNHVDPNDNRTMQIETVLFQSGKTRSNHTILINPGGPGGSGVSAAWYAAEEVASNFTDNTFDILGFDPRGVNASEPVISCYPDDESRERWTLFGDISYRDKGDKESELMVADAFNEAMFKACSEKFGDVLAFVNTAQVARDMDTIRAALNEEKLYYYGTSYGTAIGLTYAGLFPDRVGRMLLDGIEDIFATRSAVGFGNGSSYSAMDVYNDGFIGECIRAGPQGCSLAKPLNDPTSSTDTVAGLRKRLDDIFARLIARPAPAWRHDIGYGIVDYGAVNDLTFRLLYSPSDWPDLAQAFSQYEREGNATTLLRYALWIAFITDVNKCPKPARPSGSDLYTYVVCGDAYGGPIPDLSGWLSLWKDLNDRAFIGADSNFLAAFACRLFDVKPPDVYRGDLRAKLSSPILLASSTYDPITPLHNAQRIYKELGPGNARLLMHHGYGHTSMSDPSNCSEAIKKDYILNGVLPQSEEPIQCYADTKPYPVGTKPQAKSALASLVVGPHTRGRPGRYRAGAR